MEKIEVVLQKLKTSPFRAKFKLSKREKDYALSHGLETIREHAYDLIDKRLAPAIIENDGKQTPMRNHPVFIAQHATATCCRGCLQKWHKIEKGRALTRDEIDYIVDLIMAWIEQNL